MDARVRSSSCLAVALVLLFVTPVWPQGQAAVQGPQTAPTADLDLALRANDLGRARELVPLNWAASEQLFVSYLERAFVTPGQVGGAPDARTLALRLADVFFKIIEFDFARSVVLTLDASDAAKRQQLVAVVRDYFATLERVRVATATPGVSPFDTARNRAAEPKYEVGRQMAAVADRFRDLAFPRGQYWALISLVNVISPADGQRLMAIRMAVEKELGDDVTRVARRPYTEASLALAEHLGLPRRQAMILEDLARSTNTDPMQTARPSSDHAKMEAAAGYLERARRLWDTIPAIESLNYWMFPARGPTNSDRILPWLWGLCIRLGRSAEAAPLLAEALEISRPFGEAAQTETIRAFGRHALAWGDEAAFAGLVAASRSLGPVVELLVTQDLAVARGGFRPDVAEKALAMALALPDSRQRATTLEWYARSRETARVRMLLNPRLFPAAEFEALAGNPYPAAFDRLLETCLTSGESELLADALGYQAAGQAYAGDATRSADTFRRALDAAVGASNFGKAAQIGIRAVQSKLPAAARIEFASRTIEAAGKANDPFSLAQALRARASMSAAGGSQRLEDLQRAVTAAEQSGNVSEQVLCLQALANELVPRGESRAALDALEKAAAIGGRLGRPPEIVLVYQQMASIYTGYLNEPALAREAVERARQAVEPRTAPTPSGAPSIYVADAHFKLATLQRDLGRPTAALEEYARALENPDPTANWPLYHRRFLASRARYLAQLGDYEAALADWNAVAGLMKATEREFPGSQAFQRAAWLTEVARVHVLAGSEKEAAKAASEAVAALASDTSELWSGDPLSALGFLPTPDMPDPLDTFQTLAAILLRIKVPDQVVALCDSPFWRTFAGLLPHAVSEKVYLETLALADLAAQRVDQARERLLAAVAIDRTHPTAQVGGLAGSLLALGKLETTAGNAAKAKQYLLDARAAANPYDPNEVWQIERWLGATFVRLGETPAAATHYGRALEALESARERLRPEEFRVRYGEDPARIYEEYAGLLAASALATGRQQDAERAFEAAERKRAHLLNGLLATGWSRLPAGSMPEQLRRMFDLEARIGAKKSLLREQIVLPEAQRNVALVNALEGDLRKIETEHTQLLTALSQSQYRYAAPATLAASLAGPVRAALGRSRVLVEYLVTEEQSYAFVVSASGIRVVRLPIGRAALQKQVQHLLAPFRQAHSGEVDLTRLGFDTSAAYGLYQAVFAPLRPHLGAATSLLVVPDEVLHVLPFEALVEKAPGSAPRGQVLHARFASESFLVRRYTVSYLTSSAQLLSTKAGAAPVAPKRLFAMANPAVGLVAPPPAQSDSLRRPLRSGAFDAFLTPLPGAEAEVQRIARYFAGDAATVVQGAGATESAYRDRAGAADVVHFATHAVASDGQPLYSTLVLAPNAAAGEDGFLQAYEVLRTPLRAEIVVLSACETALGAEDWGQGRVGLVAAFEQAGARSVVATLWSVDEPTADLMAAFYGAMAQGSLTSAALRQAKLQLMQQRIRVGTVDVSLAHPFFWAPFILVGAPPNPLAGR